MQDENRRLSDKVHQHQKQQQNFKNNLDDSSNEVSINSMALTNVDGGGGGGGSPPKGGSKSPIIGSHSTDGQVFQMLKTQIEKQRDEIKLKDRELNERHSDIENVS